METSFSATVYSKSQLLLACCVGGLNEWTPEDQLRHPKFLGLRDDKELVDIVRES
jgi:hypothetical protein